MELSDVESFLSVQGKVTGHYADSMRAQALSDDLQLFWVVNTAGSKQFVLATSAKYARVLSNFSGHIRDRLNGKVYRASDQFFAKNPGFGSAVKRAIRDRTPGVVQRKGEHALMRINMQDRVYSPLSAA
jgi:hypothetical protein